MEKQIFISLYDEFKSIEKLDKNLLLRVILEFIIDLDFSTVDQYRSKFISKADGYSFELFSIDNRKCPLFIEILNDKEVDVQLNAGGEYLYLQAINSRGDVSKLREALRDIFLETIEEKLTRCNGKLKQAIYTISHKLDGGIIRRQSYSLVLGNCWFWQVKEVVEKVYEPWIHR